MKKRILAVALLFALVLSGCGKDKKTERDEGPIGHGTVTQSPTGKGTVPEGTPKYDFYISEVMADNRGLYLGGDSDWIEIGSREETVVSLNGYYLTDNPEKPHAFSLAGNVIEEKTYTPDPIEDIVEEVETEAEEEQSILTLVTDFTKIAEGLL